MEALMKRTLWLAAMALTVTSGPGEVQAEGANVRIVVTANNFKDNKGQAIVALYNRRRRG
jgi:uncharacterized protein (DUF2141 family)